MSRAKPPRTGPSEGEQEFGAWLEDALFWLPAEDPLLSGERAQIIPLSFFS